MLVVAALDADKDEDLDQDAHKHEYENSCSYIYPYAHEHEHEGLLAGERIDAAKRSLGEVRCKCGKQRVRLFQFYIALSRF